MSFFEEWIKQLEHSQDIHTKELSKHYEHISSHYRKGDGTHIFQRNEEIFAYALGRMPATYHVLKHVCREIPEDFSPSSCLDLGSGTGAATIAALDHFTTLKTIHSVDSHALMIRFQKEWWPRLLPESIKCLWSQQSLEKTLKKMSQDKQSFDLTVLSYVLGEISADILEFILHLSWQLTNHFLIITLPGTPRNFAILKKARSFFIEQKAFICAPCPHEKDCPLSPDDWCHFSARVPRTSWHKKIKHGHLPYEDEKFSYLIVQKTAHPSIIRFPRILKKPMKKSGHMMIDVCKPDGKAQRQTYSKSQKTIYPLLVKKEWGDCVNFDVEPMDKE